MEDTPKHIDDFQIDESTFEHVLRDEVTYFNNPNAILYDINSVRSIYAIKGLRSAPSLEKSSAVVVTSNNAFAKAARTYGQRYESSRDVSVVITDFSLANLAWLKAPMDAPDIPKTQLLAFSYAALMPSGSLLDKFMTEIDRLERRGSISARELQLLRSSPLVISELMLLTLGEDAALTGETIIQTLDRVSEEIRKEETAKTAREEEAQRLTRDSRSTKVAQNRQNSGQRSQTLLPKCQEYVLGISYHLCGRISSRLVPRVWFGFTCIYRRQDCFLDLGGVLCHISLEYALRFQFLEFSHDIGEAIDDTAPKKRDKSHWLGAWRF